MRTGVAWTRHLVGMLRRLRRRLLTMVGRLISMTLVVRASSAVRTRGGYDTHTVPLTPDGHLPRDGR
jgi:hypothetical protein